MASAWTYSDWITYDPGSATRISRLRLHIKEVSDKISAGDFTMEGKAQSYLGLTDYLKQLQEKESEEAAVAAGTSGARSVTFTRGKPIFPGSGGA